MPRHKSFSIDDAAGLLAGLFLQRSSTALTMREVAAALNLSRSTIYGTWGSKEGLFTAVLERYGPSRAPGLREVRDAAAPRAALVRLFERATAVAREPCLVINTLVELAPGDRGPEIGRLVEAALLDLEKDLRDAVGRGQAAGEIAPGVDPARAGQLLAALYLGLYVLMRSGTAGEPVLRAVVRQVEALLPAPARH